MFTRRICLAALWCAWAAGATWGQTISTNQLLFQIIPPSNSVLIAETTNTITVTIQNRDVFTNIMVNGIAGTNQLIFGDAGSDPDETPDDGIFSGDLIAPNTVRGTNLLVNFILIGEDFALATNDPSQTVVALVTNFTSVTYRIVPRPVNDHFTNSLKIAALGGVSIGTNHYGSLEPMEPVHAEVATISASGWWSWTSPFDTNVLIDTAGTTFPAILAVYTGESVPKLTLLQASAKDEQNNLPANVTIPARKGFTYRIAIASPDPSMVGHIRVRVAPGALPDIRRPAVSITAPGRQTSVTTAETIISGVAKDGLNDSGISQVILRVNGDSPIDAFGASNWFARIRLTPGTNQVSAFAVDYAGNTSAPDSIELAYINPSNDDFLRATQLTGVGGIIDTTNERATREPGEPFHAGNLGGHSIWYSFRAPIDGTLFLSTTNSSFDTVLGVYTGNNVSNLVLQASNDDHFTGSRYSQLIHIVRSNQVYHIALDGFGGDSGVVQMQYAFISPLPGQFFSLRLDSSPGGQVLGEPGVYPANAQTTLRAVAQEYFEFEGWAGTLTSSLNPLLLTLSRNHSVTARFRVSPDRFTDDFESGALKKAAWVTTPYVPWSVQSASVMEGTFAARSAPVKDGIQSSLLLVTNTAAGLAAFSFRVSSEPGWDMFEFYLNDVLVEHWSGEAHWTNYFFAVPAGTNRFEWRYFKDASLSSGLDAAFLDNVFIPAAPPKQPVPPPSLSIGWSLERLALIVLQGQPQQTYVLEYSTDMILWIPVFTQSSASGRLEFLDRQTANFPVRFYRAVAP